MKTVFALAEKTKIETNGYFDIAAPSGQIDHSGLVKGWAVRQAAKMLTAGGIENFCLEAGGDIQTHGVNSEGQAWRVGVRHPGHPGAVVKVLRLRGQGVATSGNYERGEHIYNPHSGSAPAGGIASVTVVAANVYEADRFATAAFAMGRQGIQFLQSRKGLEGYMIDASGMATATKGLADYYA